MPTPQEGKTFPTGNAVLFFGLMYLQILLQCVKPPPMNSLTKESAHF